MSFSHKFQIPSRVLLRTVVASLNLKEAAPRTIRLVTGAGEQMQVDWAVIRRSNGLLVLAETMGRSLLLCRVRHRRSGWETLIEAHENAFLALSFSCPRRGCAVARGREDEPGPQLRAKRHRMP